MKIYTRTGDRGKTGLFSGERISKSDARIEAYGDVDELSSVLGALVASLPQAQADLIKEIESIQSDLFHVGAWLATTPGSSSSQFIRELGETDCRRLETAIDRMDAGLAPLTDFILPGGHITAAWAHLARTVCRRTERHVARLTAADMQIADNPGFQGVLVYLNRLSDYLFVLARHCNQLQGMADRPWQK